MVRGLSKYQSAFLFDCCVFIARFVSSSCYSSAKTRIRPVKSYQQDEPTEEPTPDTSTQTLVNKCLAESDIDPTDIQNVMSVSYAKRNTSPHESSRQIQPIKDMYFQGSINPNTTIVMTWIPLTPQVQYQPLSKLPVMRHTTQNVLIA